MRDPDHHKYTKFSRPHTDQDWRDEDEDDAFKRGDNDPMCPECGQTLPEFLERNFFGPSGPCPICSYPGPFAFRRELPWPKVDKGSHPVESEQTMLQRLFKHVK